MAVPQHIVPIWNLLYEETVWVHAYWLLFKQLFGGTLDDLDLLNRSAAFCFYVIQDALATDVQLTLSKLSDPAKSQGKENATAEHLLNEIQGLHWPASADHLQCLFQELRDACRPIRTARNKIIAHIDRATALGSNKAQPPAGTTVGETNKALQALREFMNAAAVYLGEVPTAYEHFSARGEGGDDLIALLRMAERYEVLQREEKIPWDDLPQR